MKRRTLSTIAVAVVLSISVLTGCSDTNNAEPMSDATSEQPEQEMNPDITPEQTTFVNDLLATPLPQDEATARIEQAGYTWRLGTIDGEPQAVTMDYRIDRLTLTTQDGLVIDATWG